MTAWAVVVLLLAGPAFAEATVGRPAQRDAGAAAAGLASPDPVARARAACELRELGSGAAPALSRLTAMLDDGSPVDGAVCADRTWRHGGWMEDATTPGEQAAFVTTRPPVKTTSASCRSGLYASGVCMVSVLPHRGYARDRIARETERARARVHAERVPVEGLEIAGPVDRIARSDALGLAYRAAVPGEALGPLFATYWLRGTAAVPEGWAGSRVDLLLDTGGEATLWLGGEPVQGLNSGPRMVRPAATLAARAEGGERIPFELEVACNDLFGFGEAGQGAAASFALRGCELARFDPVAWQVWNDLEVLAALERDDGVDPAWAGLLLAELHAFTLDGERGRLAQLLSRRSGELHHVSAIGHAHLDTAWLWPLEETWRKLVRTTTTQLRLLEAYPEHRFAHSQAQHYAWLAERAPALFSRVRAAVDRGQWIPVGAMWVEPDCNLPSGESLARQLLYGQRWFEEHLGRRCTELWLPDVFGYAAQLPQLMQGAGIDRFLTQKLSWNRFTSPESHTFMWQGIDGSEVLTHFPPADTYNAEATVGELRGAVARYKDHPRSRHSLLVFGHGDGGGGPTAEMLERLRRMRDLAGVPETALRTPSEFFDDLAADAEDLRTVVGELYFEYHRGTYTSQAAVKRGNRRGERALQDAETLDALCGDGRGKAELDRLWRVLLLNQFHDILPGSSIALVYEDAARDHALVRAGADEIAAAALAALTGDEGGPTAFNTIGFENLTTARSRSAPAVYSQVRGMRSRSLQLRPAASWPVGPQGRPMVALVAPPEKTHSRL